jgi:hypothetical protein
MSRRRTRVASAVVVVAGTALLLSAALAADDRALTAIRQLIQASKSNISSLATVRTKAVVRAQKAAQATCSAAAQRWGDYVLRCIEGAPFEKKKARDQVRNLAEKLLDCQGLPSRRSKRYDPKAVKKCFAFLNKGPCMLDYAVEDIGTTLPQVVLLSGKRAQWHKDCLGVF